MKIPGYRHLVDVVLPDINEKLGLIRLQRNPYLNSRIEKLDRIELGKFVFSNGEILSLSEMARVQSMSLNLLLTEYFRIVFTDKLFKVVGNSRNMLYSARIYYGPPNQVLLCEYEDNAGLDLTSDFSITLVDLLKFLSTPTELIDE